MVMASVAVVQSFLDLDNDHLARELPYVSDVLANHRILTEIQSAGSSPRDGALFTRWLNRVCDLAKSDDEGHPPPAPVKRADAPMVGGRLPLTSVRPTTPQVTHGRDCCSFA